MSKFIALTKVLLKSGSQSSGKQNKKTKIKGFLLILLLAVAFLPIAIAFGKFVMMAYDTLAPIQQEGVILAFGLAASSLAIFFFGIFYAINVFYFSMDIENLLPLPFKPTEIMGAKFTVILLYEYLTEAVLFIPTIIAFGMKANAGMIYYIYSVLIFFLLPILPLVLASILNMVVMRFTNIAKNKDRFRLIGGIAAMMFSLGVNIYMQKSMNASDPQEITKMFVEGNNSLVNIVSKIFPSSKVAVNALIENQSTAGLYSLLLFIVITIIAVILFIFLGEQLYFKGVIGISETASKRKEFTNTEFDKHTVQQSAVLSYTKKELRILFRTPIYFMNCVLMNFLWPFFLLLPMVMQPQGMKEIRNYVSNLQDPKVMAIVLVGGFAAMMFLAASNVITSTAISREGKNLFTMKYIPMDYKGQLMAKVLSGVALSSAGMIITLGILSIVFRPPFYLVGLIFILGILGIFFSSFVGIILDLNFPKLNWDTEQKAVKHNFNGIIVMLLVACVGGATCLIVWRFHLFLWSAFGILFALYTVIDIALYYFITTKGVKILQNIEA